MKANTQLQVGIGRKASFLYGWQRTVVCCNSRCSEVTTIVDMSAGSVVTTTEEGLREGARVRVIISMLGVCGVPTSEGDVVRTRWTYKGLRMMTDEGLRRQGGSG
jgi:hypothetical protein